MVVATAVAHCGLGEPLQAPPTAPSSTAAAGAHCSSGGPLPKIPDSQALVEGLWDKITAKCPKGGRVRIDPVSGHFVGKDQQ